MKKTAKKERNSNLELLRIVSMLLIIAHHFSKFGGWPYIRYSQISASFLDFLQIGGKIGVICFIMITGYFSLQSKFDIRKLLKILGLTLFYSLLGVVLTILMGGKIPILNIIKSFFPVIFFKYWFVTDYVIVYILSPFLNLVVEKLERTKFEKLLGLYLLLFFIINSIFFSDLINTHTNFTYLVFFYWIGAYIKKYRDKPVEKIKNRKNLYVFLGSYLFIFITMLFISGLANINPYFRPYIDLYAFLNRLPIFVSGVALFLYFKNLDISSSKWINRVGASTFAIYLFHDHEYFKHIMFGDIFHTSSFYYSKALPLVAIVTILGIFIMGFLIETARKWFFNLEFMKKFTSKVENKLVQLLNIDTGLLWNQIWKFIFTT